MSLIYEEKQPFTATENYLNLYFITMLFFLTLIVKIMSVRLIYKCGFYTEGNGDLFGNIRRVERDSRNCFLNVEFQTVYFIVLFFF